MKTKSPPSMTSFFIVKIVALVLTLTCPPLIGCSLGGENQGRVVYKTVASYYTRESCLKESGQCRMANGKELDDGRRTCAAWGWKFGTKLLVKCDGRQIISVVTDRGPAKSLCKKGRCLDLSLASWKALVGENVSRGLVTVTYEVVP